MTVLFAGVLYYILKNNIPNNSPNAKATIDKWGNLYPTPPKCPIGESLSIGYVIKTNLCDNNVLVSRIMKQQVRF
jgi:hypothetical protein